MKNMFKKRQKNKSGKTFSLNNEDVSQEVEVRKAESLLNKKRENKNESPLKEIPSIISSRFYKSSYTLSNKNNATREIEIDTEHTRDATFIRERNEQISKDKLEGKIDENIYTGKGTTIIYNEKSSRDKSKYKITGSLGPMRAPTNLRATCRFDYAPGICKDYKETGYCGFGDSCVFLHDRGDYKSGWELEEEWNKKMKEKERRIQLGIKEESSECESCGEEEKNNLDINCGICGKELTEPIATLCGHYFCESCALQRYGKNKNCAKCGEDTKGVFNNAEKVISHIKKRKQLKKEEKNREAPKVNNSEKEFTTKEEEDDGLSYLAHRNYTFNESSNFKDIDEIEFVSEKTRKKKFKAQNDWLYKSNYASYD